MMATKNRLNAEARISPEMRDVFTQVYSVTQHAAESHAKAVLAAHEAGEPLPEFGDSDPIALLIASFAVRKGRQ